MPKFPSRALLASALLLGAMSVARAEPHWGEFSKGHCINTAARAYSAVLDDSPADKSWLDTCQNTGATIGDHDGLKPTSCVKNDRVVGQFVVPDRDCAWEHFG